MAAPVFFDWSDLESQLSPDDVPTADPELLNRVRQAVVTRGGFHLTSRAQIVGADHYAATKKISIALQSLQSPLPVVLTMDVSSC
jgi:hypothetical protein